MVRHYYDEYGEYRGYSVTDKERLNDLATYGLGDTPEPPTPVEARPFVILARVAVLAAMASFGIGVGGFLFAPVILTFSIWTRRRLEKLGVSKGQTSAAWAIGLSGFLTVALLLGLIAALIDEWNLIDM